MKKQEFQPIVQRRPAFKTQPDPGFQIQVDPNWKAPEVKRVVVTVQNHKIVSVHPAAGEGNKGR